MKVPAFYTPQLSTVKTHCHFYVYSNAKNSINIVASDFAEMKDLRVELMIEPRIIWKYIKTGFDRKQRV